MTDSDCLRCGQKHLLHQTCYEVIDERVLIFCNMIRRSLDRPEVTCLSKGEQKNPCKCPVATTIGDDIHAGFFKILWMGSIQDRTLAFTPSYIYNFMNDFDDGKHAELIAD